MDVKEVSGMELVVNSALSIEAERRAEVDIQITTAKAYPRVLSKVNERILEMATCDQKTAESCWYALPRAGKVIDGPSIRLAEIVAAAYQNLRIGTRVVSIEKSFVTVQGACHDLENNVAANAEVKRRITKRNGERYDDDMIVVTSNAAASIAFRNAIFKVVPRGMLTKTFDKINTVAMGDERTLTEKRKAIVEYFKGMGVEVERLLEVVNRRALEDVTLEDAHTLRGLATAIKEGTTSLDDAFPRKVAGNLKAGRHTSAKAKAAKAKKPEPVESFTPEPTSDFDVGAAKEEIENAIEHDEITIEQLTKACLQVGITDYQKWPSASDVQIESLLGKVRDYKVAKD